MPPNIPPPQSRRRPRAFTLVEILVVLLILSITATLALDVLANTEASLRADRAAREALAALRYARMLSITTGGTYGVEFDTANARFQVFHNTGATVVAQNMNGGSTYVVRLSQPELNGTSMALSLANAATNPYDITFAPLGNTSNNGTITFTYAGRTKIVTIPTVGDPTIQ